MKFEIISKVIVKKSNWLVTELIAKLGGLQRSKKLGFSGSMWNYVHLTAEV